MVQGYMLRGIAFENWHQSPESKIREAVSDYRSAAILAPSAAAYQYLARALMKSGENHYEEAHRFLQEGWELEKCPEILLGLGKYYLTKPAQDLDQAMLYYKRAAFNGRFCGFLATARIYRISGRPGLAFAWDMLRILLAPLVWITQGRRALFDF